MVKILKSKGGKPKATYISDDINDLIGYAPVKKSTKIMLSPVKKVSLTPIVRSKLEVITPMRMKPIQKKSKQGLKSPKETLKTKQIQSAKTMRI